MIALRDLEMLLCQGFDVWRKVRKWRTGLRKRYNRAFYLISCLMVCGKFGRTIERKHDVTRVYFLLRLVIDNGCNLTRQLLCSCRKIGFCENGNISCILPSAKGIKVLSKDRRPTTRPVNI